MRSYVFRDEARGVVHEESVLADRRKLIEVQRVAADCNGRVAQGAGDCKRAGVHGGGTGVSVGGSQSCSVPVPAYVMAVGSGVGADGSCRT